MIWRVLLQWTLCCMALVLGHVCWGHETLPASLLLQEQSPQRFEVHWRVPHTEGALPEILPRFPADCTALTAQKEVTAPAARLLQWTLQCGQGLRSGASIAFAGLPLTVLDVLVRIAYLDGSSESHIARPREPEVVLGQVPAQSLAVSSYFGLGVEHILTGIDHLLFVLCLILLVPNAAALLKTITAFTLAHSITLALSALHVVQVPQPPVEATIALSILFLARELARRGKGGGMALQRPWAVAFVFGLLHGFGFAGALAEVGLPQGDIPLALLLFNLGVEAGQVAFVACVLPIVYLLRRLAQCWPRWTAALPLYAIGSVSGFWWLQRMAPVLGWTVV